MISGHHDSHKCIIAFQGPTLFGGAHRSPREGIEELRAALLQIPAFRVAGAVDSELVRVGGARFSRLRRRADGADDGRSQVLRPLVEEDAGGPGRHMDEDDAARRYRAGDTLESGPRAEAVVSR